MDKELLTGIERAVYEAGASISEKMGEKAVMLFRIADGKISITAARGELGLLSKNLIQYILQHILQCHLRLHILQNSQKS